MKKMIIATILPLLFVNSFAFQVSPDIYSVDISSDWGGVEFPNLDSSGVINIDDRRLKGDGDKSFYENTIMRIGNYRPVPDVIFRSVPNTVSENDVDNHEILTEAKKNKNWLTSDHIPSYKAVKEFLRVKNVYGYYKDGYLPI